MRWEELSEDLLRIIFNEITDALLILDNLKIVEINQPFVDLIGAKNKNDLIGKSIHNFIHPDFISLSNQRLKNIKPIYFLFIYLVTKRNYVKELL